MRSFLVAAAFIIVCLLSLSANSFGGESSIVGTLRLSFGSSNSNSANDLAGNGTQAGINAECVSLYTGQHSESFPLISLEGRGGIGASLTLAYDGNVSHIVKQENRRVQASPFGLGMNFGLISIAVDHKGTAPIADDSYKLIENGTALPLTSVADNDYVALDARPWKIHRAVDTVEGRETVVGWLIKTEAGVVYRLGDFNTDPAEWNSTRNILRWHDYVGPGMTKCDSIFAFQWDLHMVHDSDSLNWLRIHYLREQETLPVRNATGDSVVPSNNSYTRASYIDSIVTADGMKLAFQYSNRQDYQTFSSLNNYEFYQKKRISNILALSADGTVVSRLNFGFTYFNEHRTPAFRKLLLRDIRLVTLAGDDSLAQFHFDYDLDHDSPSVGSIARITYQTGAMKQLCYRTIGVENDSNFTSLDVKYRDSVPTSEDFKARVHASKSMFVYLDTAGYGHYGIWDGYWHTDSLELNGSQWSKPAVSPDGWAAMAAVFEGSLPGFKIARWKNGYFDVTEFQPTTPAPWWPGEEWLLYPGDDCFLAINADRLSNGVNIYKSASFFKYSGGEWHHRRLVDCDSLVTERVVDVKMRGEVFAISLDEYPADPNGGSTVLLFGRWDHALASCSHERLYWSDNDANEGCIGLSSRSFDVGTDLVVEACGRWARAYRYDYQNSEWFEADSTFHDSWFQLNPPECDIRKARVCVAMPGAYTWGWDDACNTDFPNSDVCKLETRFFTGNPRVFEETSIGFGYNRVFSRLSATNNSLVALATSPSNSTQHFMRWNGLNWEQDHVHATLSQSMDQLALFGTSFYSRVSCGAPDTLIRADRYLGQYPWSHAFLEILDSKATFAATDRHVLALVGQEERLYSYNPYYDESQYQQRVLDTVLNGPLGRHDSYFVGGDNIYTHNYFPPTWGYVDASAFRVVDTLFRGRAPLTVVSEVKVYKHAYDTSPVTIDYKYFGGILDITGNLPKFAKTTISTPYFEGDSPDGWSVHLFYNDIECPGIHDNTINGHLPTDFLDLRSANRYGLANGGFRLDGMEYLSYTYSSGDENDPSKKQDSSISYFSVYQPPDCAHGLQVHDVYRVRLDSVHTRRDSLATDIQYVHDPKNGRPVKTKTRYKYLNSYLVDSVEYAYTKSGNGDMVDDNAIDRISAQVSYLDSAGTRTTLSQRVSDFERHGSWKKVRDYSWRDLDNPAEFVTTDNVLAGGVSFDAFGNQVAAVDGNGATSCLKYSGDGARIIAAASNCHPHELLVQDFEEGDDWDGWDRSEASANQEWSSSESFTGDRSWRIRDDENDTLNITWGPGRLIDIDSLFGDKYFMSVWVKGNHSPQVFCFCDTAIGPGNRCPSGRLAFEFDNIDSTEWRELECVFDISNCRDNEGMRYAYVQIALTNAGDDISKYCFFDNFRFHPIDAQVTTSVHDKHSGQARAELSPDNVPIRYSYDEYSRPMATLDVQGDTLSTVSYSDLGLYVQSEIEADLEDPHYGTDSVSIVFDSDQIVRYQLSVFATQLQSAGKAYVYKNGDPVDSLICPVPNGSLSEWDYLSVCADDVVKVLVEGGVSDPHDPVYAPPGANWHFWAKVQYGSPIHGPDSPDWVKSRQYRQNGLWSESVTYTDGFGRTLQVRTRDSLNGEEVSIVTGLSDFDERGRAVKSYKRFYDLLGSTSTADFSNRDSALAEIADYYDAVQCPDCDTFHYSETFYSQDFTSKLDSASSPGIHHHVGTGHISRYESFTDTLNQSLVHKVFDPDGIETRSESDRWGNHSSTTNFSTDITGGYVEVVSHTPLVGGVDSVTHESNGNRVKLRSAVRNDHGEETSTWKVDYGTIRKIYDEAGNLRFMQNDKRQQEDTYIYFKYDELGRKIEEGIGGNAAGTFNQACALMPDWPSGGMGTAKYRWHYDYHEVGGNTLLAPGRLVRVENSDASYYRNYYYDPVSRTDSVIVKLPFGSGGSLKKIVHECNRDGSMRRMTVYPDAQDAQSTRIFVYEYDAAGRLSGIIRGDGPADTLLCYNQLSYNADGSFARSLLGSRQYVGGADTVQTVDYSYDALGRLVSMNNVASLADSAHGGDDHFAEEIVYSDGSNGFFNGRIWHVRSANSLDGAGNKEQNYEYDYNGLGWLTSTHNLDTAFHNERVYSYDALGRRRSVRAIYNGDTTLSDYSYDTRGLAASSRLLQFGLMRDDMVYDTLGNLVSDLSRDLTTMSYDYRNLLDSVDMISEINHPDSTNYLLMFYDEIGLRIRKDYHKFFMGSCDIDPHDSQIVIGPPPIGPKMMRGPFEPQCPRHDSSETLYLYDGNVLLATFDQDDNVNDLFVYGPSGRIANYADNDDDQLCFILSDHLGSSRAVVAHSVKSRPSVVSWRTYFPFGETMQASVTAYPLDFQFTGKERDAHHTFEYDYFGARYYDPRIGSFSSIDKASQFASGYVYGANNPISTIDPDGNWVWFAGMALGALQGQKIAVEKNAGFFEGLFYIGGGAAIGAISADFGSMVGEQVSSIAGLATGSFANSVGFNAMPGVTTSAGINLGIGTYDLHRGKFRFPNLKSKKVGEWFNTAMNAMAVMEDLNKLAPNTPEQGYTIDPKTLVIRDAQGNFVAQISPSAMIKAITGGGDLHLTPDGSEVKIKREHPNPKDGNGVSLRFKGIGPGSGAIHLDIWVKGMKDYVGGELIRFHWDPLASGFKNPGTMLHHILFDAGPGVVRGARVPVVPELLNLWYGYYRNSYIYDRLQYEY